jgi:hypothetical protein
VSEKDKFTDKELMEIALKYVEKSYDAENLRDGDDLYNATEEDKEKCVDYWIECREIGINSFRLRIENTKN